MRGWSGWCRRGTAAAICAALGACAVGPDFHRPQMADLPGQFQSQDAAATAAAGRVDPGLWWKALGDRQLDAIVDAVVHDNLSLAQALERLQQARTLEILAVGAALPQVDASSGGGRGTGTDLTRGRSPAGIHSADHSPGSGSRVESVSGFDAAWAIDWVGGLRRQVEAVQAQGQAAGALRDAAQVAVIAETVRSYLDLRGSQTQLSLLEADIESLTQSRDLVRARFEHGITNELDVTLAERQLDSVRAQTPGLEARIEQSLGVLAVLSGRFDGDVDPQWRQRTAMPALPAQIDPGLPVDLVQRRPDVRLAQARLAADTARIGMAKAALFPQLVINGGVGTQYAVGTGAGHASVWSAGYAAYFPLLDFGSLDAQVRIADFQVRDDLLGYRRTVIQAVEEVNDAVRNLRAQGLELQELDAALAVSRRAVDLATERYARGLTDFLNVADAQRRYVELQSQRVAARIAQAGQFVDLYRALGGGWEGFAGPAALPMPQPAVVSMLRTLFHLPDPVSIDMPDRRPETRP